MALLKLCGCGKQIPMADKRCEDCENKPKETDKLYDQYVRDKKARNFYHSREWLRVRVQALVRDNYLCLHCLQNNKITKAEMVDHIIPIKVNWSQRIELNNLQSLCNSCHAKKTAEDKRRYG